MLTGVVTEITDKGPCHMLLFTSPRVAGAHYKVQIDAGTAARIRALITAETKTAELSDQVSEQMFGPDEDEPQRDPSYGRD